MLVPGWLVWCGRLSVAAVWVYEGLVAKLLGARADEQAILAAVPVLGTYAGGLAVVIGVWELLLAALVLLGRLPRLVAAAQVLTVIVFNTGGLLVGADRITEPVHLLVTNLAFLVLAVTVGAALHSTRTAAARSVGARG